MVLGDDYEDDFVPQVSDLMHQRRKLEFYLKRFSGCSEDLQAKRMQRLQQARLDILEHQLISVHTKMDYFISLMIKQEKIKVDDLNEEVGDLLTSTDLMGSQRTNVT